MEELNFLLGLVLRASNWLLDFDPKLEKDRFGGHYGVAECRAPLKRLISIFFRTSEDGQGSLLPSHCTRCACSHSSRLRMPLFYTQIPLRMNGELRRSLICRIRPTSSLF
jgi:hypothetical protein